MACERRAPLLPTSEAHPALTEEQPRQERAVFCVVLLPGLLVAIQTQLPIN